jgi:hypothetical protein
MGRGTAGVDEVANDPRILEKHIGGLREELARQVAELNRRRHALTDMGLQGRRHAVGAALSMVAVGAAGFAPVVLRIWRSYRRGSVRARAGRLRDTVGRVVDRPEGLMVEPPVVQRTIVAAGLAVVALLTKAGLERLRSPARRGTPR